MSEDGIGNRVAPDGFVYVCMACGKRSRDKYGDQPLSRGWDESCMLNAECIEETLLVMDIHGRVIRVLPDPGPEV